MATCLRCGHEPEWASEALRLKNLAGQGAVFECVNATECNLRAELRDLRAAVLAVADRMTSKASKSVVGWASALRKAVGK